MNIQDLLPIANIHNHPLPADFFSAATESLLNENFPIEKRANLLEAISSRPLVGSELAAFAIELLSRATPIPNLPSGILDLCGTGGDKAGLFNISTAAFFVVAGAGALVAKHGNRAITSASGSADTLEALGIRINIPTIEVADILRSVGCVFLFAPNFHPALKRIMPVRKFLAERGIPTIFNLLGPLLNPAHPNFQLSGIFRSDILETYCTAMSLLGRKEAWVICGTSSQGDALDEVSPFGHTSVARFSNGQIDHFTIQPDQLGITPPPITELLGGCPTENAQTILAILENNDHSGRRTAVELNAAAALCTCGLASTMADGLTKASHSISSGAALNKLQLLKRATKN